ncbi:TIGR02266 family protein [Nitrospirota bacterium]
MEDEPQKHPLARIAIRKKFHCPYCKSILSEVNINASLIKCPVCENDIKLPGIKTETVEAKNERREKRCPVALKVKYKTSEDFKIEYTKNVSRGGMFIRTTTPIELGTKMQLELFLPELNEPILLSVEVVHSHLYAVDYTEVGVGVRFLDIDPLSKSIIMNYLSSLSDCS